MTYATVEFEAGEMIFRQGDEGRYMYLVQEGEVEVLQDLAGERKQIAVLERGDFFGEMAILEDAPRSHSVRALNHARLIRVNPAGFKNMLVRNPDITVRMIRKLCRRLATTEELLVHTYTAASETNSEGHPLPILRARLVSRSDGTEFSLPDRDQITIGRLDPLNNVHPDVDLTLVDPQFSTSRRHARILRQHSRHFIVEEQATNGTFVNGKRVSAERPLVLRSGDDILFGGVQMRFVVD
jgi:CRP-like cAMP-binding protein